MHGDLRFRIVPDPQLNDAQLFANMPLGDIWPEANLKPAFDKLMASKYTRTTACMVLVHDRSSIGRAIVFNSLEDP